MGSIALWINLLYVFAVATALAVREEPAWVNLKTDESRGENRVRRQWESGSG